jgi:hypothetical protein
MTKHKEQRTTNKMACICSLFVVLYLDACQALGCVLLGTHPLEMGVTICYIVCSQ